MAGAQASAVLADLVAESDSLDELVAGLDAAGWRRATPAAGWTVADQIGHLAWTDDIALAAVTDPDEFGRRLTVIANSPRAMDSVDDAAHQWAAEPELLGIWRAGRARLAAALDSVPDGTKIVWFGPPMSAASMATARLMETWAHGQDVADTLGAHRAPTARLRHVAHIGVRTRDFAFLVNDRVAPAGPFRIELTGPGGEQWSWGPEDAPQRLTGSALDFCLLVTQRRHRADVDLQATGVDVDAWLDIAQAFAGPPGGGRSPS